MEADQEVSEPGEGAAHAFAEEIERDGLAVERRRWARVRPTGTSKVNLARRSRSFESARPRSRQMASLRDSEARERSRLRSSSVGRCSRCASRKALVTSWSRFTRSWPSNGARGVGRAEGERAAERAGDAISAGPLRVETRGRVMGLVCEGGPGYRLTWIRSSEALQTAERMDGLGGGIGGIGLASGSQPSGPRLISRTDAP